MKGLIGVIVALVIIGISYLASSFQVEPGTVTFVKRLGKIQDQIYTGGWNMKNPFLESAITFDVQKQTIETDASAASKDQQDVFAKVAVTLAIDQSKVKEIYTTIGTESDLETKIISPSIQESIKAVTAKYTAAELTTNRGQVSQDTVAILKEKLEKNGLFVYDVNIINFDYSAQYKAAIEAKVTAEQTALAEKNNRDRAQYLADQKVISAKAEAETIRIQAEAINKQGGAEYVKLKWIEAWKEGGAKVPNTIMGESANVFFNMAQ